MIHELLLALSGYPGSIFTWNKRSGLQVWSGLETKSGRVEGAAEPQRRGGTRGTPSDGRPQREETEANPPIWGALRSRHSC